MNIDWSQAPAWAQYHAFDKDGTGRWHRRKPVYLASVWGCMNWHKMSDTKMPAGMNWKKSLVERPKEETK